jgi:hypothetical protein
MDNVQWNAGDKAEVYNVNGVLVYSSSVAGSLSQINLSHLPAGTYIVKVGNKAAKVVKTPLARRSVKLFVKVL